jgi:DNA (cytosine-5)-methyltransferase 1
MTLSLRETPFPKMKLAELFTGTGGFSCGFKQTKFGRESEPPKSIKIDIVYANDFDKNSEKIFNLNNDIKLDCRDLLNIKPEEIPLFDILTAGFPCQPFSIAGERKGFKDSRSNVFWKIIEIIKYHNPRFVILENVKNLTTHDDGNTFKTIKTSLEECEYYVKYSVLNTYKITEIPQNRERIYIVCFKNEIDYKKFEFPVNQNKKPNDICNYLGGSASRTGFACLDNEINKKYIYTEKLAVWDLIYENVIKDISTNTVYQYRRTQVRENKSGVVPTLTANMGGGGHNVPLIKQVFGTFEIIRKLTPRECFRLQGFSEDYKLPDISDSALYKLAGNAITVKVIEKIAEKILILATNP